MSCSPGTPPPAAPTITAASWCGWEADTEREVLRYPGADITLRWADLRTPADRIRTLAHLTDHSRDMLRGLENALGALLAGRWL
jgi:hypothetical protein